MQSESRIFEDLAKLTTSALGTAQGVLKEVEDLVRQQFERMADNFDLVSREEFEAVKAMAAAAREENETLAARLAVLEKALGRQGVKSAAAKPARKTTARKPAKKRSPAKATAQKRAPSRAAPAKKTKSGSTRKKAARAPKTRSRK